MKINHIFLTAAICAATMSSCSSSDANEGILDNTEIKLTSTVNTLASRATADNHSTTGNFANGEKVSVWVSDATAGSVLYSNIEHTADGKGALTPATTMYYPSSGNNVKIEAYHGKLTVTDGSVASIAVNTDQTTEANYNGSDALYAVSASVARKSTAEELTFSHLFSQIKLNITKGNDIDKVSDSDVASVTVNGVACSVSGTALSTLATTTDNISLGGGSTLYGVIVPQAMSGKTITITLKNGGVFTYTFGDVTFEKGKTYQYDITLTLTGITVTSTISVWTSTTATTGNATM